MWSTGARLDDLNGKLLVNMLRQSAKLEKILIISLNLQQVPFDDPKWNRH